MIVPPTGTQIWLAAGVTDVRLLTQANLTFTLDSIFSARAGHIQGMNTSRAIEQARDVESVAQLWRGLGRSPDGITVYRDYIKRLLFEAGGGEDRTLCADRVVTWCGSCSIYKTARATVRRSSR